MKNPFAAGGSTLAPRKVNRINVSREAVVTVQQVEVLVKIAQSNDQRCQDMVEQVQDQFPPTQGFQVIPGLRRAGSMDDHMVDVLAAAMEILHQKG